MEPRCVTQEKVPFPMILALLVTNSHVDFIPVKGFFPDYSADHHFQHPNQSDRWIQMQRDSRNQKHT